MNLPKTYIPQQYEADIYQLWQKAGKFKAKGKHSYAIVMPPPNANGNLHMGHALTNAIQDSIIRFRRMRGDSALYLPGSDHAGFETWVVYEKQLNAAGKTRFDFKREELYKQVWDFVEQNKGNMENQLRILGASCDWDTYTYTLDDKVVKTAYNTFQRLWDEGLVYRGEQLVNYCTNHQTSFSDIEVEYVDQNTPLYYMKYGPFTLATTRPETKFGDTAVAVHPTDTRYQQYIGQEIDVDGLNGPFKLQVIADEMVDPNFGTGAVKITPAHDFNDYDVAQRHKLPMVTVIDHNGKLNEKAGKYAGMTVLEARQKVVEDLQAKGLLVQVDQNYANRVGVCYKCGTTIEPLLKEQWFIKMRPLADRAIEALEKGDIKYYPDSRRLQTINYLKEVRDWNISRQIAWGIPIPAFVNEADPKDWIFDTNVNQETITRGDQAYRRDPDVFDTWFSSGQWPFATLDYPGGDNYKHHYPLSLMETGFDIMYQWVARMIMLGLYVTNQVPFKEVYLHGLVLDEHGQKMSKSKGNVINPLELVEKHGSDALRMGLLTGRSAGVNQAFTEDKVVGARNFANKLWNVARYLQGKHEIDMKPVGPKPKTDADHWIISRISQTIEAVTKHLEAYRLAEAYEELYHCLWDDYADWYIEIAKSEANPSVLAWGYQSLLKLSHPFAPFVSEAIYQALKGEDQLITASWPTPEKFDHKAADNFQRIRDIVSEIRNIQTELQISFSVLYHNHDKVIEANSDLLAKLGKLHEVTAVTDGTGVRLTKSKVDAWLEVDEQTTQTYMDNLANKKQQLEAEITLLKSRLDNKGYVKSAPKELVSETQDRLKDLTKKLEEIKLQMGIDDIEEEEAEKSEAARTGEQEKDYQDIINDPTKRAAKAPPTPPDKSSS